MIELEKRQRERVREREDFCLSFASVCVTIQVEYLSWNIF